MPASVTTNLAVIGFMFLALCYFIGEQRQKIKIKRRNTLHFLTYDDIKLDELHVANNDMPSEIVEYSKELLMDAFSNVRNLDRIEKLVEGKLASLQGGKWLCLVHSCDKRFRLSEKALKEVHLTIENDGLHVLVAQITESSN